MNLFPVALALFYRWTAPDQLEVWVQRREDDGPWHGLWEFPGGGVEAGETPLQAAIREVMEEVEIVVDSNDAVEMGVYDNQAQNRTVLLYLFLFPDQPGLKDKGQWLKITQEKKSLPYQGLIPPPNHRIIDDLYQSLYEQYS
jgi:8-oxo-dGTP diphosphatase